MRERNHTPNHTHQKVMVVPNPHTLSAKEYMFPHVVDSQGAADLLAAKIPSRMWHALLPVAILSKQQHINGVAFAQRLWVLRLNPQLPAGEKKEMTDTFGDKCGALGIQWPPANAAALKWPEPPSMPRMPCPDVCATLAQLALAVFAHVKKHTEAMQPFKPWGKTFLALEAPDVPNHFVEVEADAPGARPAYESVPPLLLDATNACTSVAWGFVNAIEDGAIVHVGETRVRRDMCKVVEVCAPIVREEDRVCVTRRVCTGALRQAVFPSGLVHNFVVVKIGDEAYALDATLGQFDGGKTDVFWGLRAALEAMLSGQ